MMEVVVTTAAISCAKLQSNHHHQQTNTQALSYSTHCQGISVLPAHPAFRLQAE